MKVPASKKTSEKTKQALETIRRGAAEILPEQELLEKLQKSELEGRPLRIKAGFDPTAPDLHLGHTVLLRKLRHFQDLGHQILFLIGDFTGMIGDPTGRSATRKQMTRADIEQNAQTYQEQVFKILDANRTEIVFNSHWCAEMRFEDVLGLSARYTVARLLERDDFSKRYAAGESISLIEFLYPLVQGYDSVALKADVELGGTDQKFNLLVGRELQSQYGQEPQVIITVPLLVGLDGQRKMSKSYDNYVGINEPPYEMFAKLMSVSDELMWSYYVLLTDVAPADVDARRSDPFEAKKELATLVVDSFHPKGAGADARAHWEREKGQSGRERMVLPPGTATYRVNGPMPRSLSLVQIICDAKVEPSLSAVRRHIDAGAVKLGEALETVRDRDLELTFPGEYAVKIGKKKYLRIVGE